MPTSGLTLQSRITTLMIISSLFFIGVFTFIQINNQLTSINRYNSYQVNLSSSIVRNNLEAVIRTAQVIDIPKYLQSSIAELKESKVIADTIVFDLEGKIIASTNDELIGQNTSYADIARLELLNNPAQNKWFITEIDKLRYKIDLFIGLKADDQGLLSYVTKISFPIANIHEALLEVYKPVAFAITIVIIANILFGYILSKVVIGPIKILNRVSKIIADGDLSVRINIKTNDELEKLGLTFNYMTEQLVRMKERAENANPLTKLPGNLVIAEEVEKRIKNKQKFTVIYCDLDNFKAFNDKYGIAKGDQAIKLVAEILKEAINKKGSLDDFLGHEGGDDFILLTSCKKAEDVANYITGEFNQRIRFLYNQEDLLKGYITALSRDKTVKQFPIMTISLAGVTNEYREITSYAEVTNIAAELKSKAKATLGSVFVIDKRLG